MPRTHVVTGATGFVGGALVLELLARTEDSVVAIVRPGERTAEERFLAAHETAAAAYGLESLLSANVHRCSAVAGDVLSPQCGVETKLGEGRIVFWHSAASLRYENRYEAEIRATNIDGTRHALALATRLEAESFHYISTAYVAGKATGRIAEAMIDEVDVNNHYEASKVEAERLVAAATGFRKCILRPTIVVGHSRTMAATNFSGFYGFTRQLVQYRGMLNRAQPGFAEKTPLRVRADPGARLNLIPVDVVVEEAVRIGLCESASGVYHLSHPAPTTVGEVMGTVFHETGVCAPQFVPSGEGFEWIDERFDSRLEFYRSYILGDKEFERTRTDAVLGLAGGLVAGGAPEVRFDAKTTAAFANWYLARVEKERKSLPVGR